MNTYESYDLMMQKGDSRFKRLCWPKLHRYETFFHSDEIKTHNEKGKVQGA